VEVVLCEAGLADIAKLYCWDDASRARSRCTADGPGGCSFEYAWPATPRLASVSPQQGSSASNLTLTGSGLGGVERVAMVAAAEYGSGGNCSILRQDSESIRCMVGGRLAGCTLGPALLADSLRACTTQSWV
jgi:hypothetical protein